MSTLLLYVANRGEWLCICIAPLTVGEGEGESGRAEQQQHTLWFALGQVPDVLHHIIISPREKGTSSKHTVTSGTFPHVQLRSGITWYYFHYLHQYVFSLCLSVWIWAPYYVNQGVDITFTFALHSSFHSPSVSHPETLSSGLIIFDDKVKDTLNSHHCFPTENHYLNLHDNPKRSGRFL